MAKQLNVKMTFDADTQKAQGQINELTKKLQEVTNTLSKEHSLGLSSDISSSITKIKELQAMLESCTNSAGGLDLGKFNQSLTSSKTSLKSYADTLNSLGPAGKQAFSQLANQINAAEVPLRKTNALLNEFKVTLSNTAKWQISSSILHGFMGSVQSAIGYAQDLNESLNNIRIVTGQTSDQMAAFAAKANQAAQSLSASTTAYTDAALIFYQQGLDDSAVEERTNATIKMAHATGDAAEEVSSYMTAIWNNFDDGSQSLEHYADVITALGASTASSSSEIASGLSQFAAIAETTGLSYEYATSALATLVANTRQSADTIGNSLKTIFSRLQGLSLGDTLEDGTNLNKYSKALQKVGVDIKDAGGELRDMDDILDDLASKWDTLGRAEKDALAQTVAGTRQYTQLISLMDNWDDMKTNLQTANNSDGTLEEQAEIYAESWEAARDRVKAAAQEIYGQLLDDSFFIDINDGFAKLLNHVSDTIDSLGGLKGVLFLIGGAMLKAFGPEISENISNVFYNLRNTAEEAEKMKREANDLVQKMAQSSLGTGHDGENAASSQGYQQQYELSEKILAKKREIEQAGRTLSESEQSQLNILQQQVGSLREQAIESGKNYDSIAKVDESLQRELSTQKNINATTASYASLEAKNAAAAQKVIEAFNEQVQKAETLGKSLDQIPQSAQKIAESLRNMGMDSAADLIDDFGKQVASGTGIDTALTEATREAENLGIAATESFENMTNQAAMAGNDVSADMDRMQVSAQHVGESAADAAMDMANLSNAGREADETIGNMRGVPPTAAQGVVALGRALMNVGMIASSVRGLFQTWNNDDMSLGDKLIATFTTLGMLIPTVTSLMAAYKTVSTATWAASIRGALSDVAAKLAQSNATLVATAAQWALNAAMDANPIGAIILAITILIGLMIALAAGIALVAIGLGKLFESQSDKLEKQLKKDKETAKELSSALDEAEQKAKQLASAFDGYDDLVAKLEECTKGTQAWRDALQEVNNQALEMLSTFPELSQYVTRDLDTGMLGFSEEGKSEAIRLANQAVIDAQAATIQQNQKVRDTEVDLQAAKIQEAFTEHGLSSDFILDNLDVVTKGTQAEIEAAIENYVDELRNSDPMYSHLESTGMLEDVETLKSAAIELANTIDANTAATQAENEALATAMLGNNDKVIGSGYLSQISDITASTYGDAYERQMQRLKDEGFGTDGISKAIGVNDEVERVFAEYAKAAGLQGVKVTDSTGTDSNRAFVYEDANGEEKTVSLEAMRAAIAAAEANKELTTAAESLAERFTQLKDSSEVAGEAMIQFASKKNLENATQKDMVDIKSAVSTDGALDDDKIAMYLDKAYGNGEDGKLSAATLEKYGYETMEDFVEAFKQGIEDYDIQAEDLGKNWLKKTNEAMSNLDLTETSLETQKQLGDAINKAVANGKYEEVTQALGSASDATAEDMLALVNAINEAGDSADSLSEKYETAHKTIDGLSDGDSISADDYDKLDASYQQYFTKMLDGSYKLVGAAEDLQHALKADQIADYANEIKRLQEENQRIKDYQDNTDFDRLTTTAYNGEESNTFNQNTLQEQLDFIDKFAVGNEELLKQSEEWRQHYEDTKQMQVSALQEISEKVSELQEQYQSYTDSITENEAAISEMYREIAFSAEDLDELHIRFEGLEKDEAAMRAFNEAAVEMDRISDIEMLDADELKDYAEYLQDAADSMDDFNDAMNDNEAQIVAKGIMKMNKAIDTLADNFVNAEDAADSWKGILEQSEKSSQEYAEAMINTKSAVAELLDVSEDYVSDDFITDHLDEIAKAATGDEEAIDSLKAALIEPIVAQIAVENNIDAETLLADVNNLQSMIDEMGDITVGTSLDDSSFIEACNEMIQNSNMTADQVNAMFDAMGFEANFKTEPQPIEQRNPITVTKTDVLGYTSGTTTGPDGEPRDWEYPILSTSTYNDGYSTETGMVDAMAMAISPDGSEVPVINSITKKAGGSANNYSSGNRGGRSTPGRGSRGGRGGRGSRGRETRARERSDKKKIKHREIEDDLKELKDEKERYHEIELAIDDVNDKVEQYSALADRAFGKSKVKMLREQAKELKKLAANYREELKENQKYLEQDKTAALGYGWQFDNQGNVKNYDEKMADLVKQYNAAVEQARNEKNTAIDWWNSLSGDDQDKDSNKDKFDQMTEDAEYNLKKAEELYQDSVDALKQYEETKEKREDLIKAQREALEKALDAEVEAVDVVVQVKLKIDDMDIKYLEELMANLGDGADTFVDKLGMMGSKVEELGSKAQTSRDGLKELLGVYTDGSLYNGVDNENGIPLENSPISKDLVDKIMSGGKLDEDDINDLYNAGFTDDTISKMEDYVNNLYEINGELRDLRDEALQSTIDAFNEFTDELDRNSEKIEHLQKVTSTYKNIIDIVGKKVLDANGELTNQLNRANFNMQRNNTHALKSELDMIDSSVAAMKQKMAELQADNKNGEHNEALKQMEKQLKEMTDKRDSTYESWLDSWEAEMQAAADVYADTLAQIVDDFSKSVAGAAGTLDQLAEEFQRKSDIADIYVDDYEKIYNLSKLTRDIEKSIDDTDNIKSKKALKGLMEEIEELQENGAKLSEYDLENLRRQYELELAKQQLTEAQDAKSQVRMTRDSEGNYGYVYTADESAVADAEQNYEDKLYAMQKANADYINELQNNIISAEQACADALAELDASQFASYEEYQAAVAKIQADYAELIDGYSQQMGNVLENNNDLYNNEWKNYSDMTGYKISADEDYIDSFEETQLSMLTGFNAIEDMQDAFNSATNQATNDMSLAWQTWYDDTQTALSDGGTSIEDFDEAVNEMSADVQEQAQELEDSAEEMAEKYSDEYQDILNALSDFCTNYDSMIQKIINSNNQLSKSIADVTKAASGLAEVTDKDGNTKTPGSGGGGNGGSNGGNGGNSGGGNSGGNGGGGDNSGGKASWDRGYAAYKRINAGAWGNGISNRISKGAKEGFSKAEVELGQQIINYTYPPALHGKGYSMDRAKKLLGYDTGGYTGAWGNSDGKIALLHQKELVLNADDTENFLQAVDIIRDISQTIDLNALSASNGLATMLQSASASGSGDSQTLEQEVHITADFSGVKDRGEIEAAFDNLINRAAQFANRKN